MKLKDLEKLWISDPELKEQTKLLEALMESLKKIKNYTNSLLLDSASQKTATLQKELFEHLNTINDIKALIEIICADDLLPPNAKSKQTASIDLFLKYINENKEKEKLFLQSCSDDKLIFWAKAKLKELYSLIKETNNDNNFVYRASNYSAYYNDQQHECTKNVMDLFEKLVNVIVVLQNRKNEAALYITIDTLHKILTEINFSHYYNNNDSFHEYCRYTLIDIIESLQSLPPNIVPILCDIIIVKQTVNVTLSLHSNKARKLLLEIIERNPKLLITEVNGKKRLSLLASKLLNANNASSTYELVKAILNPKAIEFIESQDHMPQIKCDHTKILSKNLQNPESPESECKKIELNILNAALVKAIHDNNYGLIKALYEIKTNNNWHDKQQFIDSLLTNINGFSPRFKEISIKGILYYLELEKITIEEFLNKISNAECLSDSIQNLIQSKSIENDLIVSIFFFLAKRPNICNNIDFEKIKIDKININNEKSEKLSNLIIANKNISFLLPLLKLTGFPRRPIESYYLQVNFSTIIKKTTANDSKALDAIIDYLDNQSNQRYRVERWLNFEANLLYDLCPEKYKGIFWGNPLFKMANSNKIEPSSVDNDSEESSLIEGKKIQTRSKSCCNCNIG